MIRPTQRSRAFAALERASSGLPLVFGLLFVALSVPGIKWGAPAGWNPDELVQRVGFALTHDDWGFFDRTNFDNPSLPKYVMYGIGRVTYGLGGGATEYVVGARLFSVALGAAAVMLTYAIAGLAGAALPARVLATLLTLFSSQLVANAHFAHNDVYLLFFLTLATHLLVRFQETADIRWLYAAFVIIGLATSSKYNGLFLLPVPVILFALSRRGDLRAGGLRLLGLGALLAAGGFVTGTPRALLSSSSYFPNAWAALLAHREFALPGVPMGVTGQWSMMMQAFSLPASILFLAGFLSALHAIATGSPDDRGPIRSATIPLVVCVTAFNSPFWLSRNYQERFFLPFVPWLSVLAALFIQRLHGRARGRRVLEATLTGSCVGLVVYCFLRVISVDMLFIHDARIEATAFLASQPGDDGIGFGGRRLLSADLASGRWIGPFPDPAGRVPLPQKRSPVANAVTGETDFVQRCAAFYVVDYFTAESFLLPSVCRNYPAECDFIKRLRSGESRYQPLKTFAYRLPALLPPLRMDFVNPTMSVFSLEQDAASRRQCRGQAWRRVWNLETHDGSVAQLQYPSDDPRRMKVTIGVLGGRTPWDVVLSDGSARTVSGHAYELVFQARAEGARQIATSVGRNRPPWNSVGLYATVDLTPEWKTYRYTFAATATEPDARTFFNLGGSDAAVELAEVALRDLTAGGTPSRDGASQ